jgi:mono/diheme cytochrome c family protein
MRNVFKWIGIVLGALAGLIVLAVVIVYVVSGARMNKTYNIQVEAVSVPTDAGSIAQGKHLAVTRGCTDCHSQDLAGGVFINDPVVATLYASNLTPGRGGTGGYTDADWVRATRHGIGPDDKPLLFMPSQEFYYLSDVDLGMLIAYLKSVPPVDNELPKNRGGPLGRVLYLTGQVALVPAELIDHTAPRPTAPEPGVTVAYGEYLAVACMGCHGAGYSGGPIPGAPPDSVPAANITPDQESGIGTWSEVDFFRALREGERPDGSQISPEMPWKATAQMTDDELKAMWLYLQSLPAQAYGNR